MPHIMTQKNASKERLHFTQLWWNWEMGWRAIKLKNGPRVKYCLWEVSEMFTKLNRTCLSTAEEQLFLSARWEDMMGKNVLNKKQEIPGYVRFLQERAEHRQLHGPEWWLSARPGATGWSHWCTGVLGWALFICVPGRSVYWLFCFYFLFKNQIWIKEKQFCNFTCHTQDTGQIHSPGHQAAAGLKHHNSNFSKQKHRRNDDS